MRCDGGLDQTGGHEMVRRGQGEEVQRGFADGPDRYEVGEDPRND